MGLAVEIHDVKQLVIRGGAAKLCAQAANTLVRIGSLMMLARLLTPGDFGLIAMVTTAIGVLNLFRDLGLSTATIQQGNVTHEQLTALFWINVLVGVVLAGVALAGAQLLAQFFREQRLAAVTAWLSASFVFNAVGIQHCALLQRQMRFTTLAAIETASLLTSVVVGLSMAMLGAGYWSLVGMTLAAPVIFSAAAWWAAKWTPGWPRRGADVASMLRTGGLVTVNGLVVYAAYNLEKVLLGRVWGADALGVYGRAYQLVNMPTESLNSAVGAVAMSALSRVKDDPVRLRGHFLKIYGALIAITMPITFACALFADELVLLLLGPRWAEAAPIFRFLAPTILVFGLINPTWPLLVAQGLLPRSLKLAVAVALVAISGYVVGLSRGPIGVAMAFSAAMCLWLVPHLAWCLHGTVVSLKDLAASVFRPFLAALVATIVAGVVAFGLFGQASTFVRLAAGLSAMTATYLAILLFVMGQRTVYVDIVRGLRAKPVS